MKQTIGYFIVGVLYKVLIICVISIFVQYLWNWLMPIIFGLPTLTYGQIVGLLTLFYCFVIVAVSSYASHFWQPIMNLGNIFNNFINNIAYLERIFETLDEPAVVDDAPDAEEMPRIKGEVEFRDVSFSYEPGKEVLHKVSFKVEPGESVALVGPTGAGKSTIVNLVSRFYNVDSGTVLIDGKDISKVTLHSLRSQMGIMLQDSFIFSGTIKDNILYGKLDATDEEIYNLFIEMADIYFMETGKINEIAIFANLLQIFTIISSDTNQSDTIRFNNENQEAKLLEARKKYLLENINALYLKPMDEKVLSNLLNKKKILVF